MWRHYGSVFCVRHDCNCYDDRSDLSSKVLELNRPTDGERNSPGDRQRWQKRTHRAGVLVVAERQQGGTVLPGLGSRFFVAAAAVAAAVAAHVVPPNPRLSGGDVLLVGVCLLWGDSVPG